jgi:lactate permease
MKAQWSSLIALGPAMVVALTVYGMPVGHTVGDGGRGLRLFPIMWIVTAIWVYNLTVETGHLAGCGGPSARYRRTIASRQ